jgi:hypothetical protein
MSVSPLPDSDYKGQDKSHLISSDHVVKDSALTLQSSYQKSRLVRLFAALALLAAAAYFAYRPPYLPFTYRTTPIMSQSPLTGWPSRATPHPSRDTFTPTASSLQYGVIRSTPANPSELVAAFFEPDFVVDAAGRVLKLLDGDARGINTLVHSSVADDVPKPGGFRNQWRISHPRTSMPIHWLSVFNAPGKEGELREVSVYGYSSRTTELSESVDGLLNFPDVLQETFGVLDKARTSIRDGEGNPELVRQVIEIIHEA